MFFSRRHRLKAGFQGHLNTLSERKVQSGVLNNIDIAILAGGLGTRIKGVLGDTPKVLAPINGRPFIDHLLAFLAGYGARRIVMCLGHLAKKIEDHLGGNSDVHCFVEPEPRGTGGALLSCRSALESDPVLILNGDTWLDTDLDLFVKDHNKSGCEVSIICVQEKDVSRYGRLKIRNNRIINFEEKDIQCHDQGYVNGGVYLLSQNALDDLLNLNVHSLEMDYFCRIESGSIHAFVPKEYKFVDIGTPESFGQTTGSNQI